MERLTKRIGENVYFTQGKYESTLPAECETQDVRNILHRLAAYEDTGLEPQLVQLIADAICGKTGVFCPVCGDGLCLAAGKDGLEIGCFGCGEYVPVKRLFEAYRRMKEGGMSMKRIMNSNGHGEWSIVGSDYFKAFERLAAIEDILGDEYDLDGLREIVQADREGRCVVVPVKLGQPVYCLQDYFNDATMKSEKRVKCRLVDFIPVASKMFETNGLIYQFSEIGKTVFLTREEAEAALKERENNG